MQRFEPRRRFEARRDEIGGSGGSRAGQEREGGQGRVQATQKTRAKSKATPQQAWIPARASTPDAAIPTTVTAAPAGTIAAAASARGSLASDGKSACEHASADALERARERGRQRGLAQARQRARIRYGLEPDATRTSRTAWDWQCYDHADHEPPTPPHERQVEWWEGLLVPDMVPGDHQP